METMLLLLDKLGLVTAPQQLSQQICDGRFRESSMSSLSVSAAEFLLLPLRKGSFHVTDESG